MEFPMAKRKKRGWRKPVAGLAVVAMIAAAAASAGLASEVAAISDRFVAASRDMDPAAVGHVLDDVFSRGSFEWVATRLLVPALNALGDAWARFLGEWVPASGNRIGDGVSYEIYRNTPAEVPKQELRTELYVPLA